MWLQNSNVYVSFYPYKNPYFENWLNVANALMHFISTGYLSGYTLHITTITFCSDASF